MSDTGADNLLINSITRTSGSADISLAAGPTFPVNISPDANFNFTFDLHADHRWREDRHLQHREQRSGESEYCPLP